MSPNAAQGQKPATRLPWPQLLLLSHDWVAVGDTEMPYMCQVVISQRAGKYVGGGASVIASN